MRGLLCEGVMIWVPLNNPSLRAGKELYVTVLGTRDAGGVVVKGSAQDQKVASSSPTSGRVEKQKNCTECTHKKLVGGYHRILTDGM